MRKAIKKVFGAIWLIMALLVFWFLPNIIEFGFGMTLLITFVFLAFVSITGLAVFLVYRKGD